MNEYISSKLQYMIRHCNAGFSLCESAYSLICTAPAPSRPKLLQDFLYGFCFTETEGDVALPDVLAHDEEEKLVREYLPKVTRFVDVLVGENPTEQEFYETLWEYIETDECLNHPYGRAAAVFVCGAFDPHIPYYHVETEGSLSMDQQTFRKIMGEFDPAVLHKLEFVLEHPFRQKTQQASVILKMLDDCSNLEHKCVLMSRILSRFQSQISQLRLQLLRQRIDEAVVRMVDDPVVDCDDDDEADEE